MDKRGFVASLLVVGIWSVAFRLEAVADRIAPERPAVGCVSDGRLMPRGAVEGEVAGGQTRSYGLSIAAGQFVRLVVVQQGIDLTVRLFAPDGRLLVDVDTPTGDFGQEHLCWMAADTGTYCLEVMPVLEKTAPGCYEVRFLELRDAEAADEQRVRAQADFADGYRLLERPGFQRQAVSKIEGALILWRELGEIEQGAVALASLGYARSVLGDSDAAMEDFAEALAAYRAVGNLSGEAQALYSLATIEKSRGRMDQALEHYDRAASLNLTLGDLRMAASTLSGLGELEDMIGDKEKALERFDRVLELTQRSSNELAETATLIRIGSLHKSKGQMQEALRFYFRALSLVRSLPKRQQELELEAAILANIGRAYADLSDLKKARYHLRQALVAVQKRGNRHSEAAILVEVGRVFAEDGDDRTALGNFERALPLLREADDPRAEASVLTHIARARARQGRCEAALADLDRAFAAARRAADPYRTADVLTIRGSLRAALGEQEHALDELREALVLREKVGDRWGKGRTLLEMARVEKDREKLSEALELTQGALVEFETVRNQVLSTDLRATFLESMQGCYALEVEILMGLRDRTSDDHFAALAFDASERARARGLLDLLAQGQASIRSGVDADLLAREQTHRRRISAAVERRAQLAEGAADSANLENLLERLTTELQGLETEIKAESPRYSSLIQPGSTDVAEIQTHLLDSRTLLLEYKLCERKSFLWAVTRTSLASFELPGKSEIEAAALRAYSRLSLRRPSRSGVTRAGSTAKDLAELSRMLLGPVASLLQDRRLLIVSDGALHYVPFAALPTPLAGSVRLAAEPLVLRHEIVHVPSATLLTILRRQVAERRPAAKTLAVIADPVLDQGDERVTRNDRRSLPSTATVEPDASTPQLFGLPRLAFSRREAGAILAAVPAEDRMAALGFQASRETVTSGVLSHYKVIHFATHTLVNGARPEYSGIVLSIVDETGRRRRGFLSAFDVFNLELAAELVVLSGCDTAVGKEIRGEGLAGLTRAFMYAGAARVVGSLWKVDDEATGELMKLFYRRLLGGEVPPAAALRAAQVSMLRDARWRDPFFWSGFVLQGDWAGLDRAPAR